MALARKTSKKTRNLEESRKEILDAAFQLVYARGFQGVSVDDIVAKTRLTKGAFYHQFPTKLEVGYALVEEVITPMILERWLDPLKESKNPLQGILHRLKTFIGDASPQELKWGCPLNNLVQEMAPVDAGFKKRLEKALNLWIDGLEEHLIRAKKEGFLRSDVHTRKLATFVVMSHEGFYGMLKGLQDPQIFQALFESLKNYFQTLQNEKN